ncbi:hypothetical protein ACN47E_008843 [Coniothyrium glycines]
MHKHGTNLRAPHIIDEILLGIFQLFGQQVPPSISDSCFDPYLKSIANPHCEGVLDKLSNQIGMQNSDLVRPFSVPHNELKAQSDNSNATDYIMY